MVTAQQVKEQARVEQALPAERVGCVVWWSASDVRVDPVDLALVVEQHCPEHGDLVKRPQEPYGAMRRAMRRRQGAAMAAGWRWEEVAVGADGLRVALAQSERDAAAGEYRASTRLTLLVEPSGTVVRSRDPQGQEEAGAVAALLDRYGVERGCLTQQDVRALLVEALLVRGRGVRIKDHGAVYFLPAPHDEAIDRLAPAVALAGVTLLRFPVQSGDGFSVAQLTGAARAGLAEEAAALRDEVQERLRLVDEEGKGARFEALSRRLEEVEALRAKARLYRELLSVTTAEVDAALVDAEAAVRTTMRALASRT